MDMAGRGPSDMLCSSSIKYRGRRPLEKRPWKIFQHFITPLLGVVIGQITPVKSPNPEIVIGNAKPIDNNIHSGMRMRLCVLH
jgi:hypothetical protein